MKRYLFTLFIGFSLLTVAGCGFQLRGNATLPDSLKTMYVQGVDLNRGFGHELKNGLTINNVTVVESYQEGSAVFTVLDYKLDQRVLSVGSDAKVNEYELYGSVTFKVSDGLGRVLSESQKVEAQRDYQFNQGEVLAMDEEQRLLREQLHQQLVQSILRRLSALK